MINVWLFNGITSVPDLKMPHRKNDCPVYQMSEDFRNILL